MVLTDAQHPARVEELKPWPFIYPLLHNQDVPGTQEKFLSRGQTSASCTQHVLVRGTYPSEGWERQPTPPDTFPTPMIPPQTKWISIVEKIHSLQCKAFQTNHKVATRFPPSRNTLSAESNQKYIHLHFDSHGPTHLICS